MFFQPPPRGIFRDGRNRCWIFFFKKSSFKNTLLNPGGQKWWFYHGFSIRKKNPPNKKKTRSCHDFGVKNGFTPPKPAVSLRSLFVSAPFFWCVSESETGEDFSLNSWQRSRSKDRRLWPGGWWYIRPLKDMMELVVSIQPIWKILVIGSFPQVGVKKKYIWNHHLAMVGRRSGFL